MDVLRLGEPNRFWIAPAYSVKVRGLRYLWGSAGVTKNLSFTKPFILHIANDQAGEPVAIGTSVATGDKTSLGSIGRGECLSLQVEGIAGVYADCPGDTIVHCLIY